MAYGDVDNTAVIPDDTNITCQVTFSDGYYGKYLLYCKSASGQCNTTLVTAKSDFSTSLS